MAINLATKYSDKVDEVIKLGALSNAGVNHDYEFVGVQTVKVYSMGTVPLNDYNANGGMSRYGTPVEIEDSVQELTLSQKKSFTFTIDKTYKADSPEGVRDAGKALRREIDEVVIPTIDTYRYTVMAQNAYTKTFTEVSEDTAYRAFITANAAIDEEEMPKQGRIAYVSPEFHNFIKLNDDFTKACDIAQNMLIKGQVGEVDGVAVVKIPSKRLPAGVSFIITHPMATTAPAKIQDYKIHEDPPGLAGHLVEGLFYYDAFVLNNKRKAIAVNYGGHAALEITMTAGESGTGVISVKGNTAGGKLVYKTAASVTKPAIGADISSWTELPENGIVSAAAGNKIAVALSVDGKAVVSSGVITVTVGA